VSRRRIARGEGVAEFLRFDADGGEHGRLSRIWRLVAARGYLRAAIVVLAAYILAALAIGWSLDFALGGLSLLAQQVIFGPLAVTAIVLAILDKLLWLGAVFVALPSANLLLGMIPLILFTIGVMIYGAAP